MDDTADQGTVDLVEQASRQRRQGDVRGAMATYRRAVAATPDDARAWQHLGALLGQTGEIEEAERALWRASDLAPDDAATRYSLAGLLLTAGRYLEAWPLYGARFDLPGVGTPLPQSFPFPRWQGERADGRQVLVFPEGDAGNQIMMARFVPWLVARGARVTLVASPGLERLFAQSFPGAQVLAAEGALDFPDPDFWLMSSDLPALAHAMPETLPRPPYLSTTISVGGLSEGFKVGIATHDGSATAQDARRAPDAEQLRRLVDALPGKLLSLHPQDSGVSDYAETAALIAALDLVVTVDTSVAHLAGALSKRTLLLVRGFAPDWRWMAERDDSPWYPDTTLYRATSEEDWTDAIDRLIADARGIASAAGA